MKDLPSTSDRKIVTRVEGARLDLSFGFEEGGQVPREVGRRRILGQTDLDTVKIPVHQILLKGNAEWLQLLKAAQAGAHGLVKNRAFEQEPIREPLTLALLEYLGCLEANGGIDEVDSEIERRHIVTTGARMGEVGRHYRSAHVSALAHSWLGCQSQVEHRRACTA